MIIQLAYQVFDVLREILILKLLRLLYPLKFPFHLLVLLDHSPDLLCKFDLLKHHLCSGDYHLCRRYFQLYLELKVL